MATLADLVAETKRHLQSLQREPMNKLAAAVTAGATSLSFRYDTGAITAGSHLQVGLELMYVWSVDPAATTAVVERGQLGSVAAAHAADAIVTVNPKFPDFAIAKAINDDISDLSSPANGLYTLRQADLTFSTGTSGYDLAGTVNLLEIHEVRYRLGADASYRQWPVLSNYELARGVSATDFPSGLALFLHEGAGSGQPIRVVYKSGFSRLVNLADDVAAVAGLPIEMQDIPPMGAAVRMVAPREIKRNFTEAQGEPRRATEVPPGAVGASMREVARLRQNRITDEASRLAQIAPDRGFLPQSNSPYSGWGHSRSGRRW